MSNPSIACIMLVNGRESMTKRAIASYRAQTYENKRLMILNTGHDPIHEWFTGKFADDVFIHWESALDGYSIGQLRNVAINLSELSHGGRFSTPKIIVTMDSDDVSHPQRIEEQVRLLESSGAECVGYNEVLFFREGFCSGCGDFIEPSVAGYPGCNCETGEENHGEAYLYSNPQPNYAIGASLCFWRDTWKRRPFPHLPEPGNLQCAGEDAEWLRGVKCVGVSGIADWDYIPDASSIENGLVTKTCLVSMVPSPDYDPRLICSIHSGNSQMYSLALSSPIFKRAVAFDEFARGAMKL